MPCSLKVCLCAVLMYVFTNWPWETIVKIMEILIPHPPGPNREDEHPLISNNDKADDESDSDEAVDLERSQSSVPKKCDRRYCFKWPGFAFLRLMYILIFIAGAIVLQWITCFSRDRINADLQQIDNNTKKLNCKEMNGGIFGSLLLPGLIILLLACWVYVVLKLGSRCHECLRKCLEWDELNVLEADGAENLNELVEAVKSKLSKTLVIGYTAIPILYILSSLSIRLCYVFVFPLGDKHVHIQTPWRKWQLTGGTKIFFLTLTIFGFILLDILYLTVIMRYVYRCQMTIYYLRLILDKVKNKRYKRQNKAMKQVTKANKFISYLNASSGTTGFITLISVYQATSCAFILSNNYYVTFSQALVIAPRLILWGFLAIFPFYKAAELNANSEKISATGLCMRIPLPVFAKDHQNTENGQHNTGNGQHNTGNGQHNTENGQHNTENGQHNGQHNTENGQHNTENGQHNGQHNTENGQHNTENGQHNTENGQHNTENGQHNTENGQHNTENGQHNGQHNTENGQHNAENGQHNGQHNTENGQHNTENGQHNTGNGQQNPESGHRLNEDYLINLQATMFGISVRPWLPYLVIILLLLTIILQSSVGKINIPYKLWQ